MGVTFEDLWKKFPDDPTLHVDPKTGKDIFDNHCAINLSEALFNCGISLKGFTKTKCWHCPKGGIHIIRAQEMADWLKTKPFVNCPKPKSLSAKTYHENEETGIIFFRDYWRRGASESSRTGDHIDLWNGSRLTTVFSYFRAQFGFSWEGQFSDYKLSKEILFWPIK